MLRSEEFFSGFSKTNPVNVPSATAALDRLFFVVRVLNERHESHSLANWKKRIQEKHPVGLLLQKR